ncbi:MAG: 4-alpha-glucanotransferase [Lachnospiraceae bacterium]
MRASGILLPVSSLPSRYGIGCFSKEAYEFVDQLYNAGQKYWQLLPLGPTGYGDSPYQSFSTFAGNPYFVCLETLAEEGLLTTEECEAYDFGDDPGRVDYEKIYRNRFAVLRKAFDRSGHRKYEQYRQFLADNVEWLEDYALFMAVKSQFRGGSWVEWNDDIRMREPAAMEHYKEMLEEEMEYYYFIQFQFDQQWRSLKRYANQKGIRIIGDIPIYVALDSADSWSHPELFQMDDNRKVTGQAGCPPDGFSATGQLWGNPLYDWEYHHKTGYGWWIKRMAHHQKLYDVIRLDHFRGLDEYYAVPADHVTAEHGEWRLGPGLRFFQAMTDRLGELNIIAEDLGFLTESVFKLLDDTGYPGMKVLQFAFDSRESGNYLPHNYDRNCIVYTGTHDNNTVRGWYKAISEVDREYALEYLWRKELDDDEISWAFISLAQSSVAKLCVIPIQDYLDMGEEGRINTPATLGDNWIWRLGKEKISSDLVRRIRQITRLYGRL